MNSLILTKLNNAKLEVFNNDIIIWCDHDKDYKYGQYYKIDKDKNIFLCFDRETEYAQFLLKNLKNIQI